MKTIVITIAFCFGVFASFAQIPTEGLEFYYSLNGNFNDESGNDNHGVVQDSTFGDDRFNNENYAYYVDTNNTTGITNPTQYSNPQTFSVSFWFKTDNSGPKIAPDEYTVVSNFSDSQTGTSFNHDRKVTMAPDGRIGVHVYPGHSEYMYTEDLYADDKWHFIVMNLSSENGFELYVDDTLRASKPSVVSAQSRNGYWRFGGMLVNGRNAYYGYLDEIRIYNHALDSSEISALYNELVIGLIGTDVTSVGGSDGSVDLIVTGGLSPFSFNWSNGETTEDISGISAGLYIVTVTDSKDSVAVDSIRIFDTFIDKRDARVYKAVIIGDQTWMAENLDVGTKIDRPNDQTDNGIIEKYCYDNNEAYCDTFGGLYLWNEMMQYVTTEGTQGVCPAGWHLPTEAEWDSLINYLGGTDIAGGALKEAGTLHWNSPNTNATNSSGFTALSAGIWHSVLNQFWGLGTGTTFPSSTEIDPSTIKVHHLRYDMTSFYQDNHDKYTGHSVRCLLDLLKAEITDSTNITCNGYSDGTATVTPSGGIAPYSYLWDDPEGTTDSTVTGLSPNIWYHVTVTDGHDSTTVDSVILSEPVILLAAISDSTNMTCNGYSDGTATVTLSGGTAPYSYQWDDPEGTTDSTATGLSPNVWYNVTVIDAHGCTTVDSVMLSEPEVLLAEITDSTNVSCFGLSDGSATITPTGGTEPYSYIWDDDLNTTDSIVTGLSANQYYHVTITDAKNCITIDSVMLSEPEVLLAEITNSTNISCFGLSDGSATITPIGGTEPYSYLWDDDLNTTDSIVTGLSANQYYHVIITDANNCITIDSVRIFDTFIDERDAQVYKAVTIGDQIWMAENLAYLPSVSPPSEGSYTEPNYYVYDYQGTSVSEAKATVNYQTYGVLYNWTASLDACPSFWHLPSDDEWKELEMYLGMSQSDADSEGYRGTNEGDQLRATNNYGFSALLGGYRSIHDHFDYFGIDARWWSSSEYDTNNAWDRMLRNPHSEVHRQMQDKRYGFSVRCLLDTLSISIVGFNPTSIDGNDGSIDLTVSGGVSPYTYSWSNDSTTEDINVLMAGVYSVSVTDALNNTVTDSIRIYDTFIDDRDAQVYKAVTIGNQTWMAENLNAGIKIDRPNNQTDNGIIEKYCYDNNESYCDEYGGLYQWNEMMQYVTTEGAKGVCPSGWHLPTESEWDTLINYLGGTDVAGGALKEAGTLHWNSPNTNATNSSGFTALSAGIWHSVLNQFWGLGTGTTFPSSTEIDPSTIKVHHLRYDMTSFYQDNHDKYTGHSVRCLLDLLKAEITDSTNITCNGYSDGIATVTPSGGIAPYSYLWDDTAGTTDSTATGLSPNIWYHVTVTDANSCEAVDSVILTEPEKVQTSNITGSNQVNESDTVIYSVNETPGSVFDWLVSWGNVISGQGTNFINVHWGTSGTGTVSVIETDEYGCQGDTVSIEVNISTTGIESINNIEIKIYPNPFSDITTIEFPNPNGKNFRLILTDITGKVVRIVENIKGDQIKFNRENLSSGFYILELVGSKRYISKIYIE